MRILEVTALPAGRTTPEIDIVISGKQKQKETLKKQREKRKLRYSAAEKANTENVSQEDNRNVILFFLFFAILYILYLTNTKKGGAGRMRNDV